jgi:hypothetical protein
LEGERVTTEARRPDGWSWIECEEGRTLVERYKDGKLVDWFSANSVEAGSHAADILGGLEADRAALVEALKECREVGATCKYAEGWAEKDAAINMGRAMIIGIDALLARLGSAIPPPGAAGNGMLRDNDEADNPHRLGSDDGVKT